MALRSVVLAPPPGTGAPRRTVVIRPGAPRDKGHLADVLAALFGALLLLVAIVLVAVLPDKEYASPQFRLTYPDTLDDFTFATKKFDFTEDEAGHIHEFTYDLPDNVASINVRAEFTDNETYSEPDHFRIEVFDPAGNPVGTRYDAINQPASGNPADPSDFVPESFSQTFNLAPAEHPTEEIAVGLSHTENAEQVLARIVPQHRALTAGTWVVRVTLIQANDCPDPASQPSPFQYTRCQQQAAANGQGNGADPGNEFSLAGFIYTFYTPCVEQLGAKSPKVVCATP
ncbi:MAG TPA: hypothetical protein VM327_05410 [Candidatus Thermoplasmatota archaeon]|nr:hypothetical protein [Candidatus Thermoplasmatota archaeon]